MGEFKQFLPSNIVGRELRNNDRTSNYKTLLVSKEFCWFCDCFCQECLSGWGGGVWGKIIHEFYILMLRMAYFD